MSRLEDALCFQLKMAQVPDPIREYRFAAEECGGPGKGLRKRLAESGLKDWRFDLSWPAQKLAVEVEGITHYGRTRNGKMALGRHQTATGMNGDLLKYHHAMRLGWTLYRCSEPLIRSGEAAQLIKDLVEIRREYMG